MDKNSGERKVITAAVIGSGPAGFYTAEHLLKRKDAEFRVDMFDRLPTPHGLVRSGVAPDHQKIKSVTKVYDKIASDPRFRFFGLVEFGKHVTLEEYIPENLPPVQADVDKTTWVLVNLLTNAIRYSTENNKVIISCRPYNNHIRFSVKDFGPGIEDKYITRLFEKFFQVPGSHTGTGLGLAISKEFIEAQGGTIAVESEFGKGSIFYFEVKQA